MILFLQDTVDQYAVQAMFPLELAEFQMLIHMLPCWAAWDIQHEMPSAYCSAELQSVLMKTTIGILKL